MKKNRLKKTITAGVLCASLTVPSIALGLEALPVAAVDSEIIPIMYEIPHWFKPCIDELSIKYDVATVFAAKNLDAAATAGEFQKLVQLVLDGEYDSAPANMTREAVVSELARIWAEKCGQELGNVPVIKMIVYADMEEIDVQYHQGVTVAYMKDIAKGRGERVFAPKSDVTYGEMAALINNTRKAVEKELQSGSQPIAGGKYETKGSYKIEDGKVIFDFELLSHHTEKKQLKFGSGQQYEVIITDEKGEEVYKYSEGKAFTLALLFKDINPGESLKWQEEWDMTDKEGKKITPGKYKAEIRIMVFLEKGDEQIEESQLTTELDILIP